MSSWVRDASEFESASEPGHGHGQAHDRMRKGGRFADALVDGMSMELMAEVVSPTSSSSSNGSHDLYGLAMHKTSDSSSGNEQTASISASTSSSHSHASHSHGGGGGGGNSSSNEAPLSSSTNEEHELQFGEMEDEEYEYRDLPVGRFGVMPLDMEGVENAALGGGLNASGPPSATRKTSSSFSDLGDYDDCTFADVTPTGTPNTPSLKSPYEGTGWGKRSSFYSGMSNGHYVGSAPRSSGSWRSSGRNTPTATRSGVPMDEKQALAESLYPVAGEVLRVEVENAAYIIFYKGDDMDKDDMFLPTIVSGDDCDSSTELSSDGMELSEISPAFSRPPRCLVSLGAAGHQVQTANCFTREYAHPTKSLGRGLFRASTHVGNAFLKGATGLVNQTYQGGANGGVFGFAKGLGIGMLGLGTHAVKGAVRGVGQVTNLVGEMVMGTGPHFSVGGRLLLTNYRIVWSSQTTRDTIEIPLASILSIESSAIAPHVICIDSKNLLRASFAFRDESTSQEFLASVSDLYSTPRYIFAHPHFDALVAKHDAPQSTQSLLMFHPEEDYHRLKLLDEDSWMRLLDNSSYQLCPSYPATFVVPSELDDDDLQELSAYRSASRIPAVVWRHPHSGAMMARCAQPCAGLGGYVAEADKKFVMAMQRATALNGGCLDSTFHFYDARSQIAATANSAQGKGTEDPRNYPSTELHFCEIANIHAVRSSFAALSAVCQPGEDRFGNDWGFQFHNTFWLMHLARILASAQEICETLCQGSSLVVHCSDGWDRTPQLTALIEYLLDPHYRTLEGFLALVEKEWCSFGHLFQARYSHGEAPGQQEVEEQSPVFVQWLDALWQVWRQQPWAFEFDEALLAALYDHVYAGLTGAFLYNTERDRQQREAEAPTRSLWGMVLEKKEEFLNAEYDEIKNFNSVGIVLPFSSEEDDLKLWEHHLVHCDPVCRKHCQ